MAEGNVLGKLILVNGSAGSPTLTWSGSTGENDGFYYKSAGVIGVAIGGVEIGNFSSSGFSETAADFLAGDGTNAAPSFSFTSDTSSGMYRPGGGSVGFSVLGSEVLQLQASGIQGIIPFIAGNGTAAAPSFAFTNSLTTGFYRAAANSIGFAVNGVTAGNISATGIWTHAAQALFADGTVSLPGMAFSAESSSGFYRASGGALGVAILGSEVLQLQASAIQGIVPFGAADGSAAAPSYALINALTSGLYKFAANSLGFATNGITAGNISSTQVWTIPTLTVTNATTVTGGIVGVATNSSATAGNVGELITSFQTATNAPATTAYGDLTSISLTAGDWDVSLQGEALLNGSVCTAVAFGVSTTTGNSSTGLVSGDNFLGSFPPTAAANTPLALPFYRASLSGTTIHYFKMNATFSAGTPQFRGRISARRVR